MNGRLARRYARALLELARDAGALEVSGEELGRAVAAFEEPRLRPLVLSPVIDAATRLRTTKAVVAALGVSQTVGSLVGLLAERNRLAILPDVARWYEALLDDELGRARAAIRSAAPLTAAERNELTELARGLTRRDIIASAEVDPELLAGAVLEVNGTVYDGSLKTQLARLTKDVAAGGA